jgi:hypothetical protein
MRSQLINAARQYDSFTANGATTHSTSTDYCVDLFFIAGASRHMPEGDMIMMWERARGENAEVAYRILFWSRDCRGGAGEKRFFRTIAKHESEFRSKTWEALSVLSSEYGSWKDFFDVERIDADTLSFLNTQLDESQHANLLAKWFPRKGPWFTGMHKHLGITPKALRQRLVSLSNTVEQKMCKKQWETIEYSKVPSVAMNQYRNTFMRRDGKRFTAFNEDVLDGTAKVNASVLFPHLLFQAMQQGQDLKAVQAQWQSLPNYMEGSTERILPVCDVSGSMAGLPMDVSVALGLYISERNEGIFKDAVITFSESPQMHYIQGDTLYSRFRNLANADWGGCTNLQATFDLILNAALRENLDSNQMPTKLLIISDMEFDEAEGSGYGYNRRQKTNLDVIKDKYAASGYTMPEIIFWNVNGRVGNVPANSAESGVGLISGFSPAILKAVLKGQVATPRDLMLTAVMDERYAPVSVMLRLFSE